MCSFAWGPAAAAMQQLQPGGGGEEQQAQRQQLLQQRLPLDPLRAALSVCHWPEACVLAAPGSSSAPEDRTWSDMCGDSSSSLGSSGSSSGGGQLAQLPGCAAAYDPGFLLPFAICCLRQQLLAPRAFVEAGLLSGELVPLIVLCLDSCPAIDALPRVSSVFVTASSTSAPLTDLPPSPPPTPPLAVSLRALASADAGCRAAAYQALALFEAQLPAGGPGAAAHGFKEAQQLR